MDSCIVIVITRGSHNEYLQDYIINNATFSHYGIQGISNRKNPDPHLHTGLPFWSINIKICDFCDIMHLPADRDLAVAETIKTATRHRISWKFMFRPVEIQIKSHV